MAIFGKFFKLPLKVIFAKNGPKRGPQDPCSASGWHFCQKWHFWRLFWAQNLILPQKGIFGLFWGKFSPFLPEECRFFRNFRLNQNSHLILDFKNRKKFRFLTRRKLLKFREILRNFRIFGNFLEVARLRLCKSLQKSAKIDPSPSGGPKSAKFRKTRVSQI